MSKDVSEKVSLELTLLAALESVHADVDTSEIAEIQDWSRAIRGKFHGASIKGPSRLFKLKTRLRSALRRPSVENAPGSSSGGISGAVLGASSNAASHGSLQYSQMANPQLIAVCTSEPSEAGWSEFVRRFRPLFAAAIAKVARRFGKVSQELVDDLIQEVFVKLFHDNLRALKGAATTHDEEFLFGFLKVVASNIANDHFRRVASFRAGTLHAQEQIPIESNNAIPEPASSVIEKGVLLEEIDRVLKTLSHVPDFARDRAIFWLYYGQGLSAKQIAALPGATLTTKGVESTLLRLTQHIRSALTQETKKPNRVKTSDY